MLLLIATALLAQDPEGFVEIAEDRPQLMLRAGWPNRVDQITPLGTHLRRDVRARRTELLTFARRIQADARRRRYPFVPHVLSMDWSLEGSTAQLISLSATVSVTQGGGHSTDTYDALLWDRLHDRPVAIRTLFDMTALAPRFCAAYPHAMLEHLGSASLPDDDPRRTCPTLGGRPIAPADTDGNGRFDTLRVFMAVNYFDAEGYSVNLPIESSDMARLPDGYRPAFEVPGERRDPTPQE